MATVIDMRARVLVAEVRAAVLRHRRAWSALVPDPATVNLDAEADEERAFLEMTLAKGALRDHLATTYGLPARELMDLAIH